MFLLHAVEEPDGTWICKRGREDIGLHASLESALVALHDLGRELGGDFEIRVHPTNTAID